MVWRFGLMKRVMKVSKEPVKISLDDAYKEFLIFKESENVVASTIRNYNHCYKKFKDYFEIDSTFKAEDINQNMLNKYKNHLLKEDLKVASVNHYIGDLKPFLAYLESMEYIPHLELKKVRGQQSGVKFYTPEEMEKLLVRPTNNVFGAWRSWCAIAFMYSTGARIGSVVEVKAADLDLIRGTVTFRHQKNKSVLVLPLSDAMIKYFKEYINKCGIDLSNPDTLIFPAITGEPISTTGMWKNIGEYCESRGVESKGVHAFRHTFASVYIRNGGNPVKLQRILNHSTFQQTERYLHLFGEDLKVDFTDLNPLDTTMKKKSRQKKIGI